MALTQPDIVPVHIADIMLQPDSIYVSLYHNNVVTTSHHDIDILADVSACSLRFFHDIFYKTMQYHIVTVPLINWVKAVERSMRDPKVLVLLLYIFREPSHTSYLRRANYYCGDYTCSKACSDLFVLLFILGNTLPVLICHA